MNDKFDMKEFATDNNVTFIELKDNDVVYVQIPKPKGMSENELMNRRGTAAQYFEWLFEGLNVKVSADFEPLQFTVITKKEEFVARLNDDIVQL